MKKIIPSFIFLLIFISCENDNKIENYFFRDSLIGMYELRAIYTDNPIDLNNDGISQTNLWEEAECFTVMSFESFRAEINYSESNDYKTFWVKIPQSSYFLETESYDTCLDNHMVFYQYETNENTKEIIVTERDNREDIFGVLTDVFWENNVLFVTFDKELYSSQEEWQSVKLTMEYIKM